MQNKDQSKKEKGEYGNSREGELKFREEVPRNPFNDRMWEGLGSLIRYGKSVTVATNSLIKYLVHKLPKYLTFCIGAGIHPLQFQVCFFQ